MAKLDDISKIEIANEIHSPAPVQNINKNTATQWNISCEHIRYGRCILVLVCIILITIIITVPTVLVHKKKMKTNNIIATTTITATISTTTTTTKAPLHNIITDKTTWIQNGITIFHQSYIDESDFEFSSMDIDDDNEIIYIVEHRNDRIIGLQLNRTNCPIVIDGNGTHQLSGPVDVIADKKTDSIIICQLLIGIARWSRQNATSVPIIFPNIHCNSLAIDDKGYLYVSDWKEKEVRRWEIGVSNKSTIVARGNKAGNHSEQFMSLILLFVDIDYSVYGVDKHNHRVMKWMKNATTGIIVAGGNGAGANLTQLSEPGGVIVDHLGNVYVADTLNHRIMRWINGDKEGTVVVGGNGRGNQANQLFYPSDLLFDKHGNLYVFDSYNHRLQKFEIESN
ncbi:unnamed protein product [Adineta steineri]|uniref:NHL repeat containing protein-like protein n=1 Tax=Adineta steineri TaxID=433720 RepID=A0A816C5M2_9BILA|nr:unnamed protein product [Adineta steineri]CAF1399515.1 unnamed protein product [Adineta steineri]CAF1412712.1 unnamed protein product [Adineta steineri]CAF1412821.1 unnamed protein product [Adineta steineri]CAF1450861.1 unnamed protein product [Adineta steineri]